MAIIGEAKLIATVDTTQYKKGASDVEKSNKDMESSTDKTSKNMNTGFSTVAKVGIAAMATAVVAVTALIVRSFGDAVKRVDTLNNSARTFENMGFTADKVDGAMKALEKSIKGMPTPLDEAVRGMQMITASTNDIGKSQKIFSAMNNAIIGFGGSSSDVTNAVLQMSQAFAGGRIDAQTWNSMLNSNLGPALNAIARQMGITTKQLKDGLSEGTISVETFQDALIKMNQEGGGGMKSFEQIAKDATSGIGTGWANLQTAVTRGIAEIIKSIGSEKISAALSNIGNAFEGALKGIANFITTVAGNEALLYSLATVIGVVLVGAVIALGAALWTALAPALPFAAAIVAIGAAAFLIKKNWDKIQDFIQPAIDAFMKFWDIIKPFRDFIGKQLVNAWNDLKKAFNDVKAALEPFMPQMITLAKVIGVGLVAPLVIAIGLFVAIVAAIVLVVVAIARLVGWFAKAGAAVIDFGIAVYQTTLDAYQAVFNFGKKVWEAVANAFNSVVAFIKEWGATILAVILAPFALALGFFFKFKDTIISIFSVAVTTIIQVFTPIVEFFVSIFTAAWNGIVAVWQGVSGWFRDRWNEIVGIFNAVAGFFGGVFRQAWENIKGTFNAVYGYFRGIYDSIVGIFTPIGTSVGNAVGGAFKSAVNGIIRGAVNLINDFIGTVNSAIGVINNIPGVKVPKIGNLGVPQLAEGGIISQPTLAMIGEGGEAEAVIPLSKLDKMIGSGNGNSGPLIEVNIGTVAKEVDMDRVMDRVVRKLSQLQALESSGVTT